MRSIKKIKLLLIHFPSPHDTLMIYAGNNGSMSIISFLMNQKKNKIHLFLSFKNFASPLFAQPIGDTLAFTALPCYMT